MSTLESYCALPPTCAARQGYTAQVPRPPWQAGKSQHSRCGNIDAVHDRQLLLPKSEACKTVHRQLAPPRTRKDYPRHRHTCRFVMAADSMSRRKSNTRASVPFPRYPRLPDLGRQGHCPTASRANIFDGAEARGPGNISPGHSSVLQRRPKRRAHRLGTSGMNGRETKKSPEQPGSRTNVDSRTLLAMGQISYNWTQHPVIADTYYETRSRNGRARPASCSSCSRPHRQQRARRIPSRLRPGALVAVDHSALRQSCPEKANPRSGPALGSLGKEEMPIRAMTAPSRSGRAGRVSSP